jgi:glycerol uptake facilitator-like aquaporin
MNKSLPRRLVAEFIGTAFLVAAVVGSGVMAERLANGNLALAPWSLSFSHSEESPARISIRSLL